MANVLITPDQQRTDAINQMYDAQKQQQLNQLETAYNQSRSSAQLAADKIPEQYQAQANDLATQYERNRRNLNVQAAGNGINTGTGSQMALALNNRYQQNIGGLRTSQAEAQAEAQRQMADLEARYNSEVASATAENEFNRAKALYDEYGNAESRLRSDAANLAGYGDFSGYNQLYSQLYGADRADNITNNMQSLWRAQNPDIAYYTGQISAEEYRNLTGSYPKGYETPKSEQPYVAPVVPIPDAPQPATPNKTASVPAGLTSNAYAVLNSLSSAGSNAASNQAKLSGMIKSGALTKDEYNYIVSELQKRGK